MERLDRLIELMAAAGRAEILRWTAFHAFGPFVRFDYAKGVPEH
jgi:hypothetical protein